MKRAHAILTVALAALIALGLAWFVIRRLEPSYQRKRLGAWLEDLAVQPTFRRPRVLIVPSPASTQGDATAETASAAVRRIGTNGIPTLRGLLQRRDSRFKLTVTSLLSKQSLIKIRFARDYS